MALKDSPRLSSHKIVAVLCVCMLIIVSVAAMQHLRRSQAAGFTCTWTNGAATGLWNNSGNWSGCSSQVPGVGAGANNTAVLDGTSTANVSVNAALSLTALQVNAGYTGTITLAQTVTTSAFSQADGAVNSASFTVDVNGAFSLSGGTFTSSSGVMTISGAMTISGTGNFVHNGGRVTFDGSTNGAIDCNGASFNLVTFAQTGSAVKTVGSGCSLPLGSNPVLGTASTSTITLNGTFTGSGTLTSGPSGISNVFVQNSTGVLSGFSGAVYNGQATFSGGTPNFASYSLLDFNGNFEANTNAAFTAPTGTMTVARGFQLLTGATFVHSGGTLTFDGSSGNIYACNNQTFNLVTFNHTDSVKTIGADCTFPLGNNPVIGNPSASFASLGVTGTLAATGTLTMGAPTSTSSVLTINSTGTLSGVTGIVTYGNFQQIGGTKSFSNYNPFDVNGVFELSSSANFTAPTGVLSVAGNFTILSGTFAHNGGTVEFDGGTATLSCASQPFNLVVLSHTTGTKTVNSSCAIPVGSNATTATGGSLTINGTLSGSGALNVGSSGTGSNITVAGGSGTLSGFSSLHVYGTYTRSNTGGNASFTSLILENNFSQTSGTFTAPSPGTMIVKHDFTLAGTGFSAGTGTLEFGESNADATLSCNNFSFSKVTFTATTHTKTISSNCSFPLGANPVTSTGGSLSLAGTMSGTGTLTVGSSGTASNLSLQSSAALTGFSGLVLNGTLTQSGGTKNFGSYSTFDCNGSFALDSAAIFTAPSGTLTLAGNFSAAPGITFNHNGGTVRLDGTNQSISQTDLGFATLQKTETTNDAANSTLTIQSGSTLTINTALLLDGLDVDDRILVAASSPSNEAMILFAGSSTFTGDNLTVSDNFVTDNSSGVTVPLDPANSVNGGNTQNWFSAEYDQSAFRWFANANSTDVGAGLADQDTAAAAPVQGTPFRLRMLVNADVDTAAMDAASLKLQTAPMAGTCDVGFAGESYSDVAADSGDVRYYNNGAAADDAALTVNAGDPVASGRTTLAQTYNEANPLSNSLAAITTSQAGEWDFSLVDATAAPGSRYCFRLVKNSGELLEAYSVVPEIMTQSGSLTVEIVDGLGAVVDDPHFAMSELVPPLNCDETGGLLGTLAERIRVTNTTSNPNWSLTLAASGGSTATWSDGAHELDYNDGQANGCTDGADNDTPATAGQLSVDPTQAMLTPQAGCSNDQVLLGSVAGFLQGVVDSVGLLAAGGTSQTNCYWEMQDIGLSQTIPAGTPVGDYGITLVLTVTAN